MAAEFDIAVKILDPAWRRLRSVGISRVRGAARAAAQFAFDRLVGNAGPPAELTIVLADDDTVQRLNRDYRGIDKPTNVLSFGGAGDGRRRSTGEPVILGDVILARETVVAEAEAQGKSVADHVLHLVVHGVLDLLGHDHKSTREAVAMEAIEIATLARLGIADPYADRTQRRARRQA